MPLERDKSNGFKFSLKPYIGTGLFPEQFARNIPLWKTGADIIFTSTGVEKRKGNALVVDLSNGEPIRGLMQNKEAGSTAVVYAGDLSNIYRILLEDGSFTTVGSGYSLSEDSGSAVWDSGSSSWDSGLTTWDFGVVKSDQWSFVSFGEWALATYGSAPQIRKGTGYFVGMPGGVTGVFITSPGTGYVVGDTITLTGGDGTGATAEVMAVGGSGEVTEIGMSDSGSGYTTVPTGVSGGTGSALACSFTVCDMDVSTVSIFKKFGPHIIGFNTSTSGKEFIWCDADDPDTWVAASDNLAGQLEIRELETGIQAVCQLGSRLAVYGEDQLFLVSYLANDLVFGYQAALSGIGAVSKKAVVSVGRQNYGLSQQGFFATDGTGFEYIDEPAIRDYFTDNANRAQLSKTCAYHDEDNTQIRWYFPTDESGNTGGVSFNYKTNTWSILTGDTSAGDERRIDNYPLSGSEAGLVYRESNGNNTGDSPLVAWVRSRPLDLDDADSVKELDSIRIGYTGFGLTYRIGWSETENGTITWTDYASMDEGFPFHNLRTAGRWMYIELYSGTLNAEWSVADIEVIGRLEGTR